MDLPTCPAALLPAGALLLAALIDRLCGEPRFAHPLVGFGRLAAGLERRLNRGGARRLRGVLAWSLAVLPGVGLAAWLHARPEWRFGVDVALAYFALGAQSLLEHGEAVRRPLAAGDLDEARRRVACLVSRETAELDATGVARAGVESVLENGNDAIFAAIFWFALLGGPGALLYRLANTLDAMWGYKTVRFHHFGWAAARLDDLLNWLPARLTALTYALLGRTAQALTCWRTQASVWESPNAGPVMAAGAGSLGVCLGGAARYAGQLENRPPLGCGSPPTADHIGAALLLVRRGLFVWLAIFFGVALLHA